VGADTPFLFSVAALSVSLAGFAGLVATFRRGSDPRAIDIFRLRQRLPVSRDPLPLVVPLNVGILGLSVFGALQPSVAALEWLLLLLLVRPMIAFVLVLSELRHGA
jgi:hypothetical protein